VVTKPGMTPPKLGPRTYPRLDTPANFDPGPAAPSGHSRILILRKMCASERLEALRSAHEESSTYICTTFLPIRNLALRYKFV